MKRQLLDPSLPTRRTVSFSGMTANKGKVAGRVRIVRIDNPIEIARLARKLAPEDILVSGMTNPTMTPFFAKVRGIITDEGGALCHAAVISREYDLPCVVGCKVATLVLRDGDYVLLDADSGVVKRISRSMFERLRIELPKRARHPFKRYPHISESAAADTIWLSEASKHDISVVGGKAFGLSSLCGKYHVPNGFIVTTRAFADFARICGLDKAIRQNIEKLSSSETQILATIADVLERVLMRGQLRSTLRAEIKTCINRLGGMRFAVRSSGACEDMPRESFAGQYDSFLNVHARRIYSAVRRCWASLYNLRAIAYRNQKGIPHDIPMAVLIQKMVIARLTGVMFTVDPTTPLEKDRILIEIARDPRQSTVTGEVIPCRLSVDRRNLVIEEQDEGLPISQTAAVEIARLGIEIEEIQGEPQDIEFAVGEHEIFILQTRPITTL